MDPKTDKLVRRTTMIATATASYFLLTADYGPEPNFLDPIRNDVQSAGQSVKEFIFGVKKETPESEIKKPPKEFIFGVKKETPESQIKKPPPTASEKHP